MSSTLRLRCRPAQLRDDAERAGVVAALADLHVGEPGRGRQHARQRVVVDPGGQVGPRLVARGGVARHRAQDLGDLARAERRVDLRDLLAQLGVVALREAAGHDEAFRPADLLLARHLEDRVDGLLLGPVDERAGVDDDHVRLPGVGHELVAGALEPPEHHLAVDEVLGAPEADTMPTVLAVAGRAHAPDAGSGIDGPETGSARAGLTRIPRIRGRGLRANSLIARRESRWIQLALPLASISLPQSRSFSRSLAA